MFLPIDWLHLVFFALQVVLQLVAFRSMEHSALWLTFDLAAPASLFALVTLFRRRSPRFLAILRLVHGCTVVPLVFTQVGLLIRALDLADHARVLARLDEILFFGSNPLEAAESLAHPLLSEFMQWAYTAYLLMPPAAVLLLVLRADPATIARSLFSLLSVFYLSYVGYYLVPASGPNIHNNFGPLFDCGIAPMPLYEFRTPLEGVWLTDVLREWMFRVELTKKDCFPSGHVAVAVATWVYSRRISRTAGRVMGVMALGVVLSTVYLRYHYVIDVVIGVLLAAFAVTVIEAWHRRFEKVVS